MAKGKKRDRQVAEDQAFARLAADLDRAHAEIMRHAEAIPAMTAKAITEAVQPYYAHLAQQEKDALVAAHPGWGASVSIANIHPGVLV